MMRVSDLIDFNRGTWDRDVVQQTYADDDAQLILNTPLSLNWPSDEIYWWPNTKGVFTVKSAYWLGMSDDVEAAMGRMSEAERRCWRYGRLKYHQS